MAIWELEPQPDEGLYLGPATVIEVSGAELLVELPGGARVSAALALAYGFAPAAGDVVVVIGDGDDGHYVVGLSRSSGPVAFEFPGDVTIHAADGELRLSGDRGVELRGEVVKLSAEQVRVLAESVVQTADRLIQRVRGLFTLDSGEKHEVVHGELSTRAERATITSRGVVSVNGKEIHLG